MELEIHIEDFEYDTGYGVQCGDLYFSVQVEASSDEDGLGRSITEINYTFLSSTFFAVGNNGEELGEYELSEDEIARQITVFDIVSETYEREVA